ncbi:outer membrane transport energization protein ExbB [Mariprofundus ferrinatatus]|uniref:Outer membrane transport energization protein ExbB n=1 Tax=Mariprofundus ferrinatatus TaxID=1921087 RepID=A0A2K8L4W3_9PROT|nr:MotA/TolQ/ExbB proton channel family protein [Mariprofundus ferrinatatus]ATX82358.1 outer membrane transport energization protein ExbB [Mariprofundus ferrinatatus]
MDISMLIDKGGPVMWVLLGYSVVAVAIVVERLIHLQLLPKVNSGLDNLYTAEGKRVSPETAIAVGVKEAAEQGVKDLARVASRIGSEQLARMETGLRTLAWLGNTAPLLGLFGTITGMIKAFQVIEAAGGKVDAMVLAGGIWEAMVTTGAGLAVAIPILFLLHFLEGLVDKRAKSMQRVASMVIEQLPHAPEYSVSDQIKHGDSLAHAI